MSALGGVIIPDIAEVGVDVVAIRLDNPEAAESELGMNERSV
jgi:hypothetical protein